MTLNDDCYTANPFLNFFPDYDRTMHISQNIDQSLFPSTLQSVEKGPQFWVAYCRSCIHICIVRLKSNTKLAKIKKKKFQRGF